LSQDTAKDKREDLQRQIDRNTITVEQLVDATGRLQDSVDKLVRYMHESHSVQRDIGDLQKKTEENATRATKLETELKTRLTIGGAIVTAALSALQLFLNAVEIGL
jgi:predicted RNase H-like nuclease (RuvC/YqgF family)